jgi:NitT/TauT family transport system substrate-binding protein
MDHPRQHRFAIGEPLPFLSLLRAVIRTSSPIAAHAILPAALLVLASCSSQHESPFPQIPVRFGYFPNVTHAQALVGVARGDFRESLGSNARLETVVFNAGPSVVEALFADHIDIAFLGPSPAINGFLKSQTEEVRVIAGAAANGVLIVGNPRRGIRSMDQLRGRKIATPQLGNTQDISARSFIVDCLGGSLKEQGGDTEIIPLQNPDIEILFAKDQIDAAWLPEPWASRLVHQGNAQALAEEKCLWDSGRFALTVVVARRHFLDRHPDLVRRFLAAHIRLTRELSDSPAKFLPMIQSELKRLTRKDFQDAVIRSSLSHIEFNTDPLPDSFQRFFEMGRKLKFVRGEALDGSLLFDLRQLSAATRDWAGKDDFTTHSSTQEAGQ